MHDLRPMNPRHESRLLTGRSGIVLSSVQVLACVLVCLLGEASHAAPAGADPVVGPTNGTLVVVGGGARSDLIYRRFIELAGGPSSLIVVIPTANDAEKFDDASSGMRTLRQMGATNLVLLHTRSRTEADSEAFVKPLLKARAVWFGGGRQWRLVDAYLNTRTHRDLFRLLDRGGVIGGSSAGATIQGSYLVRGAREGNQIMMAPGYEVGLGFLRNVAVDQHVIARKREADLQPVVRKHPELLGIGIDEDTAIVVQRDQFEVIGSSKVIIHDPQLKNSGAQASLYFLQSGDHFDLKSRKSSSSP